MIASRIPRIVLYCTLAGAGAVSCSRPAQVSYERELARTPEGAQHAVHSERLSEVMRGLERLASERLPQELDPATAEDPWLSELVAVAESIAVSAERIPQATLQVPTLTNPERVAFHQRAALLRDRALALARDAPHMTLEQRVQATMDLQEACEGCHASYRDRPEAPSLEDPEGRP